MAIRFYCPLGHRLHGPESQQGKLVHCPVCGQRVIVPKVDLGMASAAGGWRPGGTDHTIASLVPPESPAGSGLTSVSGVQKSSFPPQAWPPEPVFLLELTSEAESPVESIAKAESPVFLGNPSIPEATESSGRRESSFADVPPPVGNGSFAGTTPRENPGAADSLFPLVEFVPLTPEAESPQTPRHNLGESGCLEDFFLAEQGPVVPPENVLWESVLDEIGQRSAEHVQQEALPTDFSSPILDHPSQKEPTINFWEVPTTAQEDASVPMAGETFGEVPQHGGYPTTGTPPDGWNKEGTPSYPGEGGLSLKETPPVHAPGVETSPTTRLGRDMLPWAAQGTTARWRRPPTASLAPGRWNEVRWLALWLSLIIVFSMGPAFRHLLLSTAPGWARAAVLAGLCQLAYVAWMVLTVHRTAIWMVMGVFASGAALSALATGLTLVASAAKPLPGGLGDIRQWAAAWFGCVLSVQALGAYLAGRLAFLWGQMDRRLAQHRLAR